MKVLLVDIDSKMPNLALMKVASYYRGQGAVDRCNYLKERGVTAYSMCNMDRPLSPDMKKLKHWTRPMIFWSIDYEQYEGGH